jgi:hypothetical protein
MVGSLTLWGSIWAALGSTLLVVWAIECRRVRRRLRMLEKLTTQACDALTRLGLTVAQILAAQHENQRRRN